MPQIHFAAIKVDGDPAKIRCLCRAQLIKAHYPAGEADEIVDLAIHAAEAAFLTFFEKIELLERPASQLTAASIAAALLSRRIEVIEEALRSIAGESVR